MTGSDRIGKCSGWGGGGLWCGEKVGKVIGRWWWCFGGDGGVLVVVFWWWCSDGGVFLTVACLDDNVGLISITLPPITLSVTLPLRHQTVSAIALPTTLVTTPC